MALARYLADKSVLSRISKPAVEVRLVPLVGEGAIATCGVVLLEVLYSARSPRDYAGLRAELDGFARIPIHDADFDRALEVQEALARSGGHRGVSLPDLIIAATAESAGLTVLHYDGDFDRIAAVTGQATEWVVPRGTAD